jgi:hypothetical protein
MVRGRRMESRLAHRVREPTWLSTRGWPQHHRTGDRDACQRPAGIPVDGQLLRPLTFPAGDQVALPVTSEGETDSRTG